MENEYYKRYEPFFGSWHIKRYIGAGSYGKVFEIERKDALGTVFTSALKVMTIPSDTDEVLSSGMDREGASTYYRSYVEELSHEIVLMSKLKGHSNIVSYEDHELFPHEDGIGWDILIRMELLTPITASVDTFTREKTIQLGIDLCRALEVCQQYHIIHRDIKPANIFISETGDFKLGDFGVARVASASTGASTRAGTTNYMAPEVFRGEKYTSNVDTYSLGLVMYQLLNHNRFPFYPPYPQPISFALPAQAMKRRIDGEPLPPPADADAPLAEIILKACAPSPADRYTSPAEMRKALEAVASAAEPGEVPEDDKTVIVGKPAWKPQPDDNETVYLFNPVDPEKKRREEEEARREEEEREEQRRKTFEEAERQRQRVREEKRRAEEAARKRTEEEARRRKEQEEAARKAEEELKKAEEEAELKRQQEEEVRRKAEEKAKQETEKPASGKKFSRRKMLGILGGAAVVAVAAGNGYAGYLKSQASEAAAESAASSTAPVEVSGDCSKSVHWRLSEEGILFITGSGPMPDYEQKDDVPWQQYRDQIKSVHILKGITTVGKVAFSGCQQLENVELPESLIKIKASSFCACKGLEKIVLPESLRWIGAHAFDGCVALAEVNIPESVTTIDGAAFRKTALNEITVAKNCKIGNNAFDSGVTISYY